MRTGVTVGISDMKIVNQPEILISYALGSCVGICIIDCVAQIAGMAHIMLSYNKNGDKSETLKKKGAVSQHNFVCS